MTRVAVLGATGLTGGLVTGHLVRAGHRPLAAGRDTRRLARRSEEHGDLDTRRVDARDSEAVRSLVRSVDVLVNCAGPFTELGEPVVEACIDAGVHYLDCTGEQPFMKRVHDRHDGPARSAGVTVVNGLAFEYALGDCAAAVGARRLDRAPREIQVTYAWSAGTDAVSPGTRASILRVLGHPGFTYRSGGWHRQPVGRTRGHSEFLDGTRVPVVSFPSGEIVTLPRHLPVDTVQGWIALGRAAFRWLPLAAPVIPPVVRLLQPLLDPLVRRPRTPPDPAVRRTATFRILVEARSDGEESRAVEIRGQDPYGLTARLLAAGVGAVLEGTPPAGVLAPAQALEPEPLLHELARDERHPDAGRLIWTVAHTAEVRARRTT